MYRKYLTELEFIEKNPQYRVEKTPINNRKIDK
jgi:hypothetical protein